MLNNSNETVTSTRVVTWSRLAQDLQALGLRPGMAVELHASVRRVGWVVGGPDTLLQAVLDVLGPQGTLMMWAGWEDNPYHMDEWDPERWKAYLRECPTFEPARSRADRRQGILTEYLRTWPGAHRSSHPEASMVAVGRLASRFTQDQPHDYPYGPGSPLERLVAAGGQILLLGSPLERVTLLHLAEHLAKVEGKRIVKYRMPVLRDGERVWDTYEEFDSSRGAMAWPGEDYFGVIVREYLKAGRGREGLVGNAPSCLFDAPDLLAFGVAWMEANLRA